MVDVRSEAKGMAAPSRADRRGVAVLLAAVGLAVAFTPGRSVEVDDGDLMVARAEGGPAAEPLAPWGRRTLLDLYAPLVLLAPGERALPASAEWYMARARVMPERAGVVVTASTRSRDLPRLKPARSALGGSADPADWTTYGHAYRAADGGVLLQYWFFYPFNKFHGVGDHEADWEHVTVRLGPDGRPRGAWYSRHDWNAPGKWFGWSALEREGTHPVVLSARGSHASYARPGDVAWYDEGCSTVRPERAAARGCHAWRTWSDDAGGLVDLGAVDAPGAPWLGWPGRWGAEGSGPPGPAFQRGWCSLGAPGCG